MIQGRMTTSGMDARTIAASLSGGQSRAEG